MILISGKDISICKKLCDDLKIGGFFVLCASAENLPETIKSNKCKIVIIFSSSASKDEKICRQVKAFDESIIIIYISERKFSSRYLNIKHVDYQFFLPISSTDIIKKLHFIYTYHFNIRFEEEKIGAVFLQSGKIFIYNKEVDLSPSENFILRFCIHNYPEYISPQYISAFGNMSAKSVPALISMLNKKSMSLFSQPIILSKRFKGYKLNYIR